MRNADQRILEWKKKLLDLGKRNRLINFRETKRSNLKITFPILEELYKSLVIKEDVLSFPYISVDVVEESVEDLSENKTVYGDLSTDRSIVELQKTLASLRNKARIAMEEQGVNILYLSFGFLKWKENSGSDHFLLSPIVLVPVRLTLESITSPFILSLHEDEVVINPTLAYKLENDFGIVFPDFDEDENDITRFLENVKQIINPNGWDVLYEVELGLLSFLKINMYKDLERNTEAIKKHPITKALTGDTSEIVTLSEEYDCFNHDQNVKPVDTYQVVDADSSQQDAILYSKKGVSFILQGPPGTGKSQTITNIIAEALADGKKILFVSEKMAALEVVHKRLSQAGLIDFCLTLHSHKANKKEVLDSLGKTLNSNRFRLQREALDQLDVLKTDRIRLNQYNEELHTTILPLGFTIYEINGRLAKLHKTPDIIFPIDHVRETTTEKLNLYQYLLREFSTTLGKMHEDYAVNPWRGCGVSGVSHELRHNIETYLRRLIPSMKRLADIVGKTSADLELNHSTSLASVEELVEILNVASRSPKIPMEWVDGKDISHLAQQAENFNLLKAECQKLVKSLLTRHENGYFALPASQIAFTFNDLITHSKELINASTYSNEAMIIENLGSILDAVNSSIEKYQIIWSVCKEAERHLGVKPIENIKEALLLTRLFESIISNPKPASDWYDHDRFKVVKRLFAEARKKYEDLEAETKDLLSRFDREILDVDYSAMLKRFKTEYTSILKILKKSYWADKKAIQSLSKEIGQKLTDEAIIKVLNELKVIGENKSWIEENDELMTTLLGGNYLQSYTDWPALAKGVENFEFVLTYFGFSGVTQQVREILTSGIETEVLNQKLTSINTIWESGLINTLDQTLAFTTTVEVVSLDQLADQLKSAKSILADLSQQYAKMLHFNKMDATFQETIEDFTCLQRVQEIAGQVNGQSKKLRTEYQYLFAGMDTNWEAVLSALSWTNDLKRIIQKYSLPKPFIERICIDDTSIEFAQKQVLLIKQGCKDIDAEWAWFIALFEEKDELLNTELSLLHQRLEICLLSLASLEEWIDFRSSRERCKEVGLSDYMDKVESQRITCDLIVPAFLKRFYRLWLDAVLPDFQSVYSFRRRSQDTLVQDFKNLDVSQLQIARARVKEQLVSRLPDINRLNGPVDEVSILRRELNKQRRIMPLRKLFRVIPNLLLTLKPCLMMSPLSVSLFLEAENYQFDIVIFDEASQVRTEDAIGAIMRGKQIIIAGDSKQLPPTNFFTANTMGGDFDTDDDNEDEYDDSDGYESVLDEAVTVLPSRTLLWHYRSRHEHLIAFSNAKIYNQQLITFPSFIDRLPDHGVEYIEVENGIYDRSGKRNNVNEARKVAEIVFEQILKYPKRSMGIVTFSEAQQQAVEAEIRRLRIKSQQYEWYFTEDKEEAFFVKNLENVQGDERDTIIFSIGYAKDHNGVMHMNFGPLSKSGGYRRLNVAITRAKFNVKLVGSIKPTDIDIEITNSEGVKMLRSY